MGFVTALEAIKKLETDLYVVSLPDGTEVIFRLPSYKQASQYAQVLVAAEGNTGLESIIYNHIFEEYVTDNYLAVHDPNLKAGIPETIAKTIMYLSGVGDDFKEYTEALLDMFRGQTQSILSIMRRNICAVFSGYKFSDVDAMTFQELVKVYIDAETILLQQGIIQEGLKFAEPEKEKPFRVEDAINRDTRDYQRFDSPDGGGSRNLKDDPAYRAKMEEFRIKQKLRQGG